MFVEKGRPDAGSNATSLIGESDLASVSSSVRRRSFLPATCFALVCERSPKLRQPAGSATEKLGSLTALTVKPFGTATASEPPPHPASTTRQSRSRGRRRTPLLTLDFPHGGPRRAAHAPRRLGGLGHPLEPRPRAGHRAAGEGLLGVRPARDRVRSARSGRPQRARPDLPLDGADPVEPDRRGR